MANNFDWNKYPVVSEAQAAPVTTGAAAPGATFDWSKYPTVPAPSPPHRGIASYLEAAPLALLSGIGEGTREVGQLAATPVNYLIHELGGPTHLIQLPRASITHALGLPQDRPIEAIGETIPALAGADISAPLTGLKALGESARFLTPGITSQAAGGALYGAGQAATQDRGLGMGALTGGAIGAAGGAVGEGVSALGKPIGSFISREIMEPLTNKAAQMIARSVPAENPLTALGARLNAARAKAQAWAPELDEASKAADKGGKFANDHYKEVGTNILEDLKDQVKEDPQFYTPVFQAVKNKMELAPTSYKSAVAQRSALNRLPQTWELTNKPVSNMLKGISGKLKDALDQQIENNASDNPAAQDFADKWLEHRRNYQFLKSFEQTPIAAGNSTSLLKYNKPLAESVAGELPSESTLQHFLPRGRDEDTLKMEHLGNLLGNQNLARQALKQEYFRPAQETDGTFNPSTLLSRYKKLSSKQKDYFFSPEEKQMFNAALTAKAAGRKALLRHLTVRYGTPTGLGALLGMGLSEHEHEGWIPGAIAGAGVGAGISAAPRFFLTPARAAHAARLAEQGFGTRGISYPLTGMTLAATQ